MKTFKQFIVESQKSIKPKASKHESILSWNSSFNEQRNHLNEGLLSALSGLHKKASAGIHGFLNKFKKPLTYDRTNGNHNFTNDDLHAIGAYSSSKSDSEHGHGSSKNMNYYLRNRSRTNDNTSLFVRHHAVSDVYNSIKKLSRAFRPNTTNKEALTTYSGVPPHIGNNLMQSGKNSHHVLAGFTSTSKDKNVASVFAETARDGQFKSSSRKERLSQPLHMLKIHVEPGAGLDIAAHSHFDHEKEVLLHHGAHMTYHHTTTENHNGKTVLVHHVTVHPTHKDLDSYKPYKAEQ